jgi:CubicO group peptidase (beta-lactamase class C family)
MLQGTVHPAFARVAEVFEKQLPAHRPGGAALTVYHRGQVVVDIWGGTRDKAGTPWAADTLALSYSTTKGIASTLLHIFADRHALHYDQRVAHYWPEFAQNGKGQITVRQLLCHEAGLYDIRNLIEDSQEMNDWPHMLALLEQAQPLHRPGKLNGYHGLTYGFLIGGLLEKVTGKTFAQLLNDEIAAPLQLDGCYVGLPDSEFHRAAKLIRPDPKPQSATGSAAKKPPKTNWPALIIERALSLSGFDNESTKLGLMPKGISRYDWNSQEVLRACNPSAGGMFTARSLAKIYAMLAEGGTFEGHRYISRPTFEALSTVQNTARGAVIPIPMRWRLGYHRVFTTGPRTPNAFGHFGFGGSGAWCDPSRGIAMGYTVNSGTGSPFGDMRLARINTAVIRAAETRGTLRGKIGVLLAKS